MTATTADVILGSTTLRQVSNVDHRTSQTTAQDTGGGAAVVQQVSGIIAEEVTSFTTEDVAAIMAIGTNTFVSVGSYVAAGTITVPFQERDTGGIFKSGSNHNALSGTDALTVPTSIECAQDEEEGCKVSSEIHWISSDGFTRGCTGSTGNALAAQSFNESCSLGKVLVNAAALTGVQSVRINPGIQVLKSRGDGAVYPVIISIEKVMPSIEITVDDMSKITLSGIWTAMSSANIYLRQRADSGTYTADATTVHHRITFAAGTETAEQISASRNGNGTTTITLKGKTLTFATGVAIP
jgi:hypothetical protein